VGGGKGGGGRREKGRGRKVGRGSFKTLSLYLYALEYVSCIHILNMHAHVHNYCRSGNFCLYKYSSVKFSHCFIFVTQAHRQKLNNMKNCCITR